MNPVLEVGVFLVLPYLAVALFVIGALYRLVRWLSGRKVTGLRSVAVVPNTFGYGRVLWDLVKRVFGFYTLPKMEKDRSLIVGGLLFHWGIWIVLVSHGALLFPALMASMGPGLHDFLSLYVGGGAGVAALAGLLLLTVRRTSLPRLRALNVLDDYFAPAIILTLILFGLIQTLVIRPDFMGTVSPWLTSLFVLSPNLSAVSGVDAFTIVHIAVACVFVAYIPYGKMVHWAGYLFNPVVTGPSFVVSTKGTRPLPGLKASGGGGGP